MQLKELHLEKWALVSWHRSVLDPLDICALHTGQRNAELLIFSGWCSCLSWSLRMPSKYKLDQTSFFVYPFFGENLPQNMGHPAGLSCCFQQWAIQLSFSAWLGGCSCFPASSGITESDLFSKKPLKWVNFFCEEFSSHFNFFSS